MTIPGRPALSLGRPSAFFVPSGFLRQFDLFSPTGRFLGSQIVKKRPGILESRHGRHRIVSLLFKDKLYYRSLKKAPSVRLLPCFFRLFPSQVSQFFFPPSEGEFVSPRVMI